MLVFVGRVVLYAWRADKKLPVCEIDTLFIEYAGIRLSKPHDFSGYKVMGSIFATILGVA
ncbi:MAG: hypothetical protein KDJ37_06665 [Hyphomicrobiaceae bacterium]|nr:hypothetical protein [Hyphomicrobiaceae bacterium]